VIDGPLIDNSLKDHKILDISLAKARSSSLEVGRQDLSPDGENDDKPISLINKNKIMESPDSRR